MLEQLFQRAARIILEHCAANRTELVDTLVLVPNFPAGAALNRALLAASGQPVLLAPRLLTFPAWAATAQCAVTVMPDSHRAALLYHALKARDWFDAALLWTMCDELGQLFDELTYQAVSLPADKAAFAAQLLAYYQQQRHSAIEFEAKLVHELWFALSQNSLTQNEVSPAALYALQLGQLARTADVPLFVVGLPALSRLEQNCLAQYRQRHSVIDIAMDDDSEVTRTLQVAWPANLEIPLRQRAAALANRLVDSPLQTRLSYCGAYSLEDEASAADTQIRCWLAQGRQSIAVVVQDRISARRLRALLERAQILVADETGWSLDTTTASAVVMRWLDALLTDFSYQDTVALIKSSHVFADWDDSQREQAAWQIDHALRRHGPVSGCAGLLALLRRQSETAVAIVAVSRLQTAAQHLGMRAKPLYRWLTRLTDSLTELGMLATLAADAAGQQLLALLAQRRHELAGDTGDFSFAEFHRWLGRELENGAFVETDVDSPVIFTHLAATRLRGFDAVLILGADAAHLPSLSGHSIFFNQAVRSALGLSTHALEIAQIQADLVQLFANVVQVRALWRIYQDGEVNPVSPWLERLDSLHQLTWGSSLIDNSLREQSAAAQIISPDSAALPLPVGMPQPSLLNQLIPDKISVSAYNTLVACPYQYFARHVLGLNQLDEISAEMAKSDYGQAVHVILKTFHLAHARSSELPYDTLVAELTRISLQVFAPMLADDYYVHAWQQRWLARIPAYLDWQIQREQENWLWYDGEVAKQRSFMLDEGHELVLYGRLDRIDKSAASYAVLDYKTSNSQGLRDKVKQADEDVQLAAYALLMQTEVGQTAFVSLDGDNVNTIELLADVAEAAANCGERLITLFGQLHQQAPLPANGIEQVCRHCDMRGLCRRDYWVGATPD